MLVHAHAAQSIHTDRHLEDGIDDTWDFSFMWSARGKAKCKGSVVTSIELVEGVESVGPKLKQLEATDTLA